VVVSMSSSQMRQRDTLQTILDGLGRLDLDVIASTARMVACDELDVPPNCHLHDWLPQPEVFAGSAAVVTHAGHGTVMAALAAGAPLVCVPLGRDQPSTAARLASLGAGVVATPATVRAAVTTVLADDSYRAVARRLRATLASLARAISAALPPAPPR
jgi:MGT family glycosyltransferase